MYLQNKKNILTILAEFAKSNGSFANWIVIGPSNENCGIYNDNDNDKNKHNDKTIDVGGQGGQGGLVDKIDTIDKTSCIRPDGTEIGTDECKSTDCKFDKSADCKFAACKSDHDSLVTQLWDLLYQHLVEFNKPTDWAETFQGTHLKAPKQFQNKMIFLWPRQVEVLHDLALTLYDRKNDLNTYRYVHALGPRALLVRESIITPTPTPTTTTTTRRGVFFYYAPARTKQDIIYNWTSMDFAQNIGDYSLSECMICLQTISTTANSKVGVGYVECGRCHVLTHSKCKFAMFDKQRHTGMQCENCRLVYSLDQDLLLPNLVKFTSDGTLWTWKDHFKHYCDVNVNAIIIDDD
jgi:hypothetical protein